MGEGGPRHIAVLKAMEAMTGNESLVESTASQPSISALCISPSSFPPLHFSSPAVGTLSSSTHQLAHSARVVFGIHENKMNTLISCWMLLHSKGLPAVPALGLQKRPHCYNKTSSLWEHRAMVLPPGGIARHLAPTERLSVFCLVCCRCSRIQWLSPGHRNVIHPCGNWWFEWHSDCLPATLLHPLVADLKRQLRVLAGPRQAKQIWV